MNSSQSVQKETAFDGMGHTVRTMLLSDPSGTDYVDTVYDGFGRVYTASTPYRSTSEVTYGLTKNWYDALGRKIQQTDSDGTSNHYWCYDNLAPGQPNCHPSLSTVVGQWVDHADENGNDWQQTTDALGRLISVFEPNGTSHSPSMETDYAYDLLSNLLSVKQCGAICTSPAANGPVNRSFAYDSLSRLLSAANPETGTTIYSYDANGNVQNKTDARNVSTAYGYDVLNRVLSKSYSNDPSGSPLSCYQYDVSSTTCSQSNGNLIGRLTVAWTQSASKTSACSNAGSFLTKRAICVYDPLGRLQSEQQYTPATVASGTPYSPQYQYDLAGNLITSTTGVGPVLYGNSLPTPIGFTSTYDGAGRLQSLSSNLTVNPVNGFALPATLFAPPTGQSTSCADSGTVQYWAFGGLMNAAYGNGLTLNRTYDNRLRTTCETDTGSTVTNATSGSAAVTITGAEQTK